MENFSYFKIKKFYFTLLIESLYCNSTYLKTYEKSRIEILDFL